MKANLNKIFKRKYNIFSKVFQYSRYNQYKNHQLAMNTPKYKNQGHMNSNEMHIPKIIREYNISNPDEKNIQEISEAEKIKAEKKLLLDTNYDTSLKTIIRALSGNALITLAKFGSFFISGSSVMLAEAIHTLVDTGNQVLLLIGFKQANKPPDAKNPYGQGRSAFFYSLISAMGIFWVGAGVTMLHGIEYLMHLPTEPVNYGPLTWSVCALSFVIDGAVLVQCLRDLYVTKPKDVSFINHLRSIKDPFLLTVILEDFAATSGILIAIMGIVASDMTGNPMWDGVASLSVGGLLAWVAVTLVKMNRDYLIGKSIDTPVSKKIEELISKRKSVDSVYSIISRWEGPSCFYYKMDVDFNGSYFAEQLFPFYQSRFKEHADDEAEIKSLLNQFSEDVTRLMEKEVFLIKQEIQDEHPEAKFIEIQPHAVINKATVYQSFPENIKIKELPNL
eukprot:TRINITY_DN2741_c0_g2_i1.p1 TRINITY_DN2741_c0_g2~~TRINITY_DN2741_c0_g2_i1.p1  ORF type:complete len:448 (-),score=91.91 TRINITY_DN2741_c0_g2_i1:47-1390(-)